MNRTSNSTIDTASLLGKLSHFQLPSKCHYILMLISACIGGEATYLDINITNREVVLESDAHFPDLANNDLASALMTPNSPLLDMAIGINAALRLRGAEVEMDTYDDSTRCRWRLTSKHQELSIESFEQPKRCRIRLRSSWRFNLFGSEENYLITGNCHFPPIPIEVNREFNYPLHCIGTYANDFYPYWHGAQRRFLPGKPLLGMIGVRADTKGLQCDYRIALLPGLPVEPSEILPEELPTFAVRNRVRGATVKIDRCYAILALEAPRPGNAPHGALLIYHNGVIIALKYPNSPEFFLAGGASVLMSSYGLERDYSRFGIIENSAYLERLEWLKVQLRDLYDEKR